MVSLLPSCGSSWLEGRCTICPALGPEWTVRNPALGKGRGASRHAAAQAPFWSLEIPYLDERRHRKERAGRTILTLKGLPGHRRASVVPPTSYPVRSLAALTHWATATPCEPRKLFHGPRSRDKKSMEAARAECHLGRNVMKRE